MPSKKQRAKAAKAAKAIEPQPQPKLPATSRTLEQEVRAKTRAARRVMKSRSNYIQIPDEKRDEMLDALKQTTPAVCQNIMDTDHTLVVMAERQRLLGELTAGRIRVTGKWRKPQ